VEGVCGSESGSGRGQVDGAGYAAPFPDVRYKAGVRRFPQIGPDVPDAEGAELSRRARRWWNAEWDGHTFMAVGMKDPNQHGA
jgi:haloalkane dehalogenase